MTEDFRYPTLRDYLALLRRQRWLVLGIVLAVVGVALAISLSQTKQYEATASVAYNSVSDDAGLVGIEIQQSKNLLQVATSKAEALGQVRLARQVRRRLKTSVPAQALDGAVTANVGIQTAFVEITARWSDPAFAAKIANAYAGVAVHNERQDVNKRVGKVIKQLEATIGGTRLKPTEAIVNYDKAVAQQNLTRVRSIRQALDPADVVRQATVAASPISPKPKRNAILGGIIGLAIALLIAFVRDSLDRRIRSPKDVHQTFGYPILGRVGLSAMGSAGQLSNGRAILSPADIEAFRMLRTNMAVLDADSPPRSVLVTSGLPQEGKSTVAVSLAAAAAAAGQRTLLVEADLRRPVLSERTGVKRGPGLAEYLNGDVEPREILQTVPIRAVPSLSGDGKRPRRADPAGSDTSALVCITAGRVSDSAAELLASERCRDFLEKVNKAYDLVVIDTSPLLSTADPTELMPLVESVLICVRLDTSTHEEAKAVVAALDLLPPRPVGLVVTGMSGSEGEYGYYGYYG